MVNTARVSAEKNVIGPSVIANGCRIFGAFDMCFTGVGILFFLTDFFTIRAVNMMHLVFSLI
jgi:hypothetical protein